MYHLTQGKKGLSSRELGRRLGVSQTTAWKLQHKLMQVMLERDHDQPLTGARVEVDDAYLGGERSDGTTGRGTSGTLGRRAANAVCRGGPDDGGRPAGARQVQPDCRIYARRHQALQTATLVARHYRLQRWPELLLGN